jgi:aromatic-L-amino-acid/L-tryptophan decarboxylase
MAGRAEDDAPETERAALDMDPQAFAAAGHRLVDELASFYAALPERRIAPGDSPAAIRALIGQDTLPEEGRPAEELLEKLVPLLAEHSLHNGHPRFFGYITSSAAPLGALADLVASALNSNVGLWDLAPLASEVEAQTVRWLAELVGFPVPCGGILSSGGNMANILAFTAARRARIPWDVRTEGLYADSRRLTVYVSRETHTWIQKAADLTGIGTNAIRWIETDADQRLRPDALERQIEWDLAHGCLPFLVVGTAGNVSTGAVDPLADIARVSRRHGLWFHVDGAYGAPAAVLPEAPAELKALSLADSVALDPHKWLYVPIEAACTLVRAPDALHDAFGFRPSYYKLDEDGGPSYYEQGLQNTRGFRALKVWLCLRNVGRAGYERMIRDNVALARRLHEIVASHDLLEAASQHLSITTFRYRPPEAKIGEPAWRRYLDSLNLELLGVVQKGGEAYLSNAVIEESQFLRACIVNFRTRVVDVEALAGLVAREGRRLDDARRPAELR